MSLYFSIRSSFSSTTSLPFYVWGPGKCTQQAGKGSKKIYPVLPEQVQLAHLGSQAPMYNSDSGSKGEASALQTPSYPHPQIHPMPCGSSSLDPQGLSTPLPTAASWVPHESRGMHTRWSTFPGKRLKPQTLGSGVQTLSRYPPLPQGAGCSGGNGRAMLSKAWCLGQDPSPPGSCHRDQERS